MSFSSTTPTRPAPSSRTASCPSRPRSTKRTRTPTKTASATSNSETTRLRAPTRRVVPAARTSRSTTSKPVLLGFLEPHRHSAWFPVLPGTRYVPGRPRLPSEEAVFSLNPSVVAMDAGLRDSWTCSDGQEAKAMAGETAWLLFRQLYTALGTSYRITLGFLRMVMTVMIDFARRNEMFSSPSALGRVVHRTPSTTLC